jgi:hypothetical protein
VPVVAKRMPAKAKGTTVSSTPSTFTTTPSFATTPLDPLRPANDRASPAGRGAVWESYAETAGRASAETTDGRAPTGACAG